LDLFLPQSSLVVTRIRLTHLGTLPKSSQKFSGFVMVNHVAKKWTFFGQIGLPPGKRRKKARKAGEKGQKAANNKIYTLWIISQRY
jgi:hypothetical protein